MPLIFSSLDRIEVISCAMELEVLEHSRKRTWYNSRKFKVNDYIAIVVAVIILCISIYMTYKNGGRFYNPFI